MPFTTKLASQLQEAGKEIAWVWHGFLARGKITLLTSQWKTGKTTLLGLLLNQRVGGGTLAGLAVSPGRSVIVSEESYDEWARRQSLLDMGPAGFVCRPFSGPATPAGQAELEEYLAGEARSAPTDLFVFDPLVSTIPPAAENNTAGLLQALAPFRRLADAGQAVLLLHHPKKGKMVEGLAARGSGALSGFVDITIEMHAVSEKDLKDRRRRLLARSRYDETPRSLLIELAEDHRGYALLADEPTDEFEETWIPLKLALEDAEEKLTIRKILEQWPDDFSPPILRSLRRWLNHAHDCGLVFRTGLGNRNQPYRFWLPAKEQEWKDDPLHDILHPEPIDFERIWKEEAAARLREAKRKEEEAKKAMETVVP